MMHPSSAIPVRVNVVARGAALLAACLLAACASSAPPTATNFPPLDFSYLPPINLNVARVDVTDQFVPSGQPPDVTIYDPVQPAAALEQMARERLRAVGGTGHAVFAVDDAALTRDGDRITGSMRVELDILEGGDAPVGFARATVVRSYTGALDDLPAVLYGLTKQMMDQMNIEFEYQVRRSLGRWLLPEAATAPPMQTAPLPPPEVEQVPPSPAPNLTPAPAVATPPPTASVPATPQAPPPDLLAPPLPPFPSTAD